MKLNVGRSLRIVTVAATVTACGDDGGTPGLASASGGWPATTAATVPGTSGGDVTGTASGTVTTATTSGAPVSTTGGPGSSTGTSATGGTTVATTGPGTTTVDPPPPTDASCPAGSKPGSPSGEEGIAVAGVRMNVRVPPGYDPTKGSPFIMVYAPAGADAAADEGFVGLTPPALARGYIIAYLDNIPGGADEPTFPLAAMAPKAVSDRWCVDQKRIYLTGHSNGGSFSEALVLKGLVQPAAIAPSAAGFPAPLLKMVGCPRQNVPSMKMHGSADTLFPIAAGNGGPVAQFWAECQKCGPSGPRQADGCIVYGGCTGGSEVRYCQSTLEHGLWPPGSQPPPTVDDILNFFDRFRLP